MNRRRARFPRCKQTDCEILLRSYRKGKWIAQYLRAFGNRNEGAASKHHLMIRARNQRCSAGLNSSRLQANQNRIEANRPGTKSIRQPEPDRAAANRGVHHLANCLIGERRRSVAGRVRRGPGCDPTPGTIITEPARRQASDRQCRADKGAKWKLRTYSQDQPSFASDLPCVPGDRDRAINDTGGIDSNQMQI